MHFLKMIRCHLSGKRILTVLGAAVLMAGLVSCSSKKTADTDVLTQKVVEEGRTPVTVLVKHAFVLDEFEKIVEEKFPDIDLIQVGNYTRDMGIEGYRARLKNDDLTDIVMTWPLEVGEEYWQDRLLDLSGMEFTSKYNIAMLNSISRDGKLYYLPGPSQIRGIIYNKTLFEEHGWEVPSDFEGFVQLCQTIEKSGIRSFQLGFANGEVLDTAFVGYSYADCFSKPADRQWMDLYNQGEGTFGAHFKPALDTFQALTEAGVFQKEDLNIDYSQREQMLFTRQCAMIEDSILMTKLGSSRTGNTDEFALMPFFNPGSGNDWARLYMVCYIGMNKHLTDPGNEEKYDKVMKVMNYISTQEGQEAMMQGNGSMFSSVNGTALPDIPEIAEVVPALSHGRFAVFPELKRAQSALREGLAGLLKGELTQEDVIRMVDQANLAPVSDSQSEKLGTALDDFSMVETGSFVTDVMREKSGCTIALFLDDGKDGRHNAKGISASLYKGDVTSVDIARILPDLKYGEKGYLWKVSMTGADLLKTLEYAIPVENGNDGWFYYFSGLKMEFAPWETPGARVKEISLADGSKLEPEVVYTVAVMEDSVPEELLKTCEKTDLLISDLLMQALKEKNDISPARDGRFMVVNPE